MDDTKIRIGIFDSDNKDIKLPDGKGKKVFSFKIVPDEISTEFLFEIDEIKQEVQGRRLYIGDEFDSRNKIHKTDPNLSLGGDSGNINKAGKKVIIETDVYNRDRKNTALTKEAFARAIFNGEIKISDKSWSNFRHIFEKIQSFIAVESQNSTNDAESAN
jgi:hypothetical protein